MDARLLKNFKRYSRVLQSCYAEKVQKVFVLYPNWFFNLIFKTVSKFMTT